METLAYAHLHTAYEEADLNPAAYELKLFNNFNWQPPSSAWIRFLSTVMAISVLSMAGSSLAAYVRTNGSPLNIRATPGGAVIGSLRNGTYIGITGSTSSGWSQLTTGGWVSSSWISGSGGGGGGGGSGYGSVALVRTNGSPLHIRSSPSGAIVGSVANGSRISLSGRTSGGWSQLSNGNWVSSTWIRASSGSGGSGGSGGGGGVPSGSLQVGSSGSAVTNLQNRLRTLGFYSGPVTGYYGRSTEAAVRNFQASARLPVNGIAGPQTLSVLYGGSSGGSGGGGGTPSSTLRVGSNGSAVTNLQNRLRTLGFYNGPVTGYYGRLTESAVRDFQRSRRIQANGIAGPQTLGVLYRG